MVPPPPPPCHNYLDLSKGFNDITTGAGGGCRKGGKEVKGVLCDKPAARGAYAYVLRAIGSLGLYRISIGSIYIYIDPRPRSRMFIASISPT